MLRITVFRRVLSNKATASTSYVVISPPTHPPSPIQCAAGRSSSLLSLTRRTYRTIPPSTHITPLVCLMHHRLSLTQFPSRQAHASTDAGYTSPPERHTMILWGILSLFGVSGSFLRRGCMRGDEAVRLCHGSDPYTRLLRTHCPQRAFCVLTQTLKRLPCTAAQVLSLF